MNQLKTNDNNYEFISDFRTANNNIINNNINKNNYCIQLSENKDDKGEIEEEILDNFENVNKNTNKSNNNLYKIEVEPDEIEIELVDKATNTDTLSKEELSSLVSNNIELNEKNTIYYIEHEIQQETPSVDKIQLMNSLIQKEKILDLINKNNEELKSLINRSNEKMKLLENNDDDLYLKSDNEKKLLIEIKEIEKEIKATYTETERYKKLIEDLKYKMEFRENLERRNNIKNILKQEKIKYKELKEKLNSLKQINNVQGKYLDNQEKHNSEKINIIKSEIEKTKVSNQNYFEKWKKLENFTNIIHNKIIGLEILVKNLKIEEHQQKKSFNQQEFNDTIGIIDNLKKQIEGKRKIINDIKMKNDEDIYKLLNKNKNINMELGEIYRIKKELTSQKNELNRKINTFNKKK